MLARLHRDLDTRGIALRVVEAHAKSRDLLRAEGVEDRAGYLGRHLSVDTVVSEFELSLQHH
jgi:sulfate permease, SulP family